MVNNSTNINKMNYHLSLRPIEHKKRLMMLEIHVFTWDIHKNVLIYFFPILATTVRDFDSNAFLAWELKDPFLKSRKKHHLSLQLQFRTRDTDGGVLFHLPSTGDQFITVEVSYLSLVVISSIQYAVWSINISVNSELVVHIMISLIDV